MHACGLRVLGDEGGLRLVERVPGSPLPHVGLGEEPMHLRLVGVHVEPHLTEGDGVVPVLGLDQGAQDREVRLPVVFVDRGEPPQRPQPERRVVRFLGDLRQPLPGLRALPVEGHRRLEVTLRLGKLAAAERGARHQQPQLVAVAAAGEDRLQVLLGAGTVALHEREAGEHHPGDRLARFDADGPRGHRLGLLRVAGDHQPRRVAGLRVRVLR